MEIWRKLRVYREPISSTGWWNGAGGQWCRENGIAVSTYFSWQKKVFQALKEVQEVSFAEVPIMEHSQLSGHIVAAMEVSGVRIQVYEGADGATLQAILQAAKSC